MLGIGDGFFIETVTQSSSRILHPAKILGTQDGSFTAEVEEADVPVEPEAELFIFFEVRKKFVKQAAKIEAVYRDGPNSESASSDLPAPTIEFITVGEPAAAESRENFRVSTVMSDLKATLDNAAECKLLDVSAVGLSVFSTKHHNIGATLSASVNHEGESYSGMVCVRGIRSMGKNRIRYGLHCVDGSGSKSNLKTGLRQITMAIQREQLRRLAHST